MQYFPGMVFVFFGALWTLCARYPWLPVFISHQAVQRHSANDAASRLSFGSRSQSTSPRRAGGRLPPSRTANHWSENVTAQSAIAVAAFGLTATVLNGRYAARRRALRSRNTRSSVSCRARSGEEGYYDILNVDQSATEKEIKSSFRKLAKVWHPDVNKDPGAQERFQKIATAYEALSDPQKRRNYDRFGAAGVQGLGGSSPDLSSMNLDDILGDMFGQFFGRGGRRQSTRGPRRGSDLRSQVRLSFEDACFGCSRVVRVRRQEACASCTGTGRMDGAGNSSCNSCSGSGVVVRTVQSPLGVMQSQQECSSCFGTGIEPSEICPTCRGRGTTPESKEVSVKVPAGCSEGLQLCLRGEADKGTLGGPAGDLYITLKVADSNDFVREGFNIFTECDVGVYDAILGTIVSVKTLDGELDIAVPAGTQPDTRLRLKRRGVPKLGRSGDRGDHYVFVKVKVPRAVTAEDQHWLRNLKQGFDDSLDTADTV